MPSYLDASSDIWFESYRHKQLHHSQRYFPHAGYTFIHSFTRSSWPPFPPFWDFNYSFIDITEKVKPKSLTHLLFRNNFIVALRNRAEGIDRRRSFDDNPKPTKRIRVSSKHPTLPPERLDNLPHTISIGENVKYCRYCAYKVAVAKLANAPLPEKHRSSYFCTNCDAHLCKKCFNPYHSPLEEHDNE